MLDVYIDTDVPDWMYCEEPNCRFHAKYQVSNIYITCLLCFNHFLAYHSDTINEFDAVTFHWKHT